MGIFCNLKSCGRLGGEPAACEPDCGGGEGWGRDPGSRSSKKMSNKRDVTWHRPSAAHRVPPRHSDRFATHEAVTVSDQSRISSF